MIAPLLPAQVKQALTCGSQDELDEFNRLVERLHLSAMLELQLENSDEMRLRVLRDKLFPATQLKKDRRGPGL